MSYAQVNHGVVVSSKLLARFDRESRAKELAMYRAKPEAKMPVMLPVRQMGARVLWPSKFK